MSNTSAMSFYNPSKSTPKYSLKRPALVSKHAGNGKSKRKKKRGKR